jgi:CBS domain-containing protein
MSPVAGMSDPLWSVLWVGVAAAVWWVGATAAGVRYDLVRLEKRGEVEPDYAVGALLRRLQDEPVTLGLRLRFSRFLSAAFVPLCLATAVLGRPWEWLVGAWVAGWFLAAAAEATGGTGAGGRPARRRGGALYGAWGRLTLPVARAVRPLLRVRAPAEEDRTAPSLVRVESRAALSGAGGRLGREERRLLRRLLASTTIVVADIMTPWEAVDRIRTDASPAEAADRVRASGHSRLPVVAGDGAASGEGKVVGLVTVKDLLPRVHRAAPAGASVGVLVRPVYFVRREETVADLLDELKEGRVHLAVVVDGLGRQVGIVTMEDVLEEIVGELHDERERGTP